MADPRPSPETRRVAVERAQGRCEYCRCPQAFAPDTFEVDHVLPASRGGTAELSNLALACGGCNAFKHIHTEARDPTDGSLVPLFNPRIDHWASHFVWSHDGSFLLGTTPTGRATIARLRMNRPSLVNLRRLLMIAGWHPPEDGGLV